MNKNRQIRKFFFSFYCYNFQVNDELINKKRDREKNCLCIS